MFMQMLINGALYLLRFSKWLQMIYHKVTFFLPFILFSYICTIDSKIVVNVNIIYLDIVVIF